MINKLKKVRPSILVIGDLMIDKYLWGECFRISPEAPVQVIDVLSESEVLGGAGNVLNNLKSLGAMIGILSVIGDCKISKNLKSLLASAKVDETYLITESGRVSSKKTRIIASHQQVVRYDIETSENINKESELKLLETFKSVVAGYDLVILSDYSKGVLTEKVTKSIIKESAKYGIKVIADPKGNDYSKYFGAYLLTPNKKEASIATGVQIQDKVTLLNALKKLKSECGLSFSLITLSDEGIAFLDRNLKIHPTVAREVFDVTGAGDTVIASLGYAIASNLNLEDAVKFANLAAGVVVGKIGSATVTFDEIIEYQHSLHNSGCEEKILSLNSLLSKLQNHRNNQKNIVFTNGCFDILHVGHVKYLHQAKKLGDILIVAINSDNSVKLNKGPSRPINSFEDRACIIASLESVDYVIKFEDETPIDLIKKITPDFLVKGGDYKNKQVAGQEFAKELVLIDFLPGKSTTNTIKQIKK